MVIDQPWGSSTIGEGISEFLADGIVHLETYFDENEMFRRRLRILKMRGTNHAKMPYDYDIASEGFVLLDTGGREFLEPKREKPIRSKQRAPVLAEVTPSHAPLDLTLVRGIGPKRAVQLRSIGITSAEDLAASRPRYIASKVGVSGKEASRWIRDAREATSRK